MMLLFEFRKSFRSWLNFTIGLLLTFTIFASFFDFFREDAALMDQLLQNFPEEFRAAFGFANVNLSEVEGYLSFIISYIVLVGAVYGMKLGVGLLSAEPREKTSDFLLSKPVRRWEIVAAKLEIALILLVAQALALFTLGLAEIKIIIKQPIDVGIFALLVFAMLLVQLFFLGIGSVVAAAASKIKSIMPVALGIVFFFFIIELVNESLHLKELTYLTPFAYFKGSSILTLRHYEWPLLAIDLTIFVVATGLSFWIYQRKDFHAV
ncbi:MAG: ABC transporter permease subunit [Eubacteriales bacterium]|nr:ABC transporter permease subunit [Eubacteriales bacterium]